MSSLALNFNGVELQTTNHENQTWMTSTELAKALGYSRADMVSKIYDRNKDEFSEKMSKIIDPKMGFWANLAACSTNRVFFRFAVAT